MKYRDELISFQTSMAKQIDFGQRAALCHDILINLLSVICGACSHPALNPFQGWACRPGSDWILGWQTYFSSIRQCSFVVHAWNICVSPNCFAGPYKLRNVMRLRALLVMGVIFTQSLTQRNRIQYNDLDPRPKQAKEMVVFQSDVCFTTSQATQAWELRYPAIPTDWRWRDRRPNHAKAKVVFP